MDEIHRVARVQRRLGWAVAIGSLIVGAIKFMDLQPKDRLLGLVLFLVVPIPGFAILFFRERHLQRTGKRPADKPTPNVMWPLMLGIVGLIGLARLLADQFEVFLYGVFLGLGIGLSKYLPRDVYRLRAPSGGPNGT